MAVRLPGDRMTLRTTRLRYTGPDAATVLRVWLRDEGHCFRCGGYLNSQDRGWHWAVQHRQARRAGGTRNPAINDPANLMILCTGCHTRVETQERRDAYANGWALRMNQDPELKPALHWRDGWVLLRSDHYEPAGGAS